MKYSSIFIVALLALLTSCSTEITKEPLFDFSGNYEGKLDCLGELSEAKGESVTLSISKTETEGEYLIDLMDDLVFKGIQNGDVLVIDTQTLNEDQSFDVVTLGGEIQKLESEIVFDFVHNVDDEGESQCTFPIERK